jgi:outer membrane lipoprotein-sorting protein
MKNFAKIMFILVMTLSFMQGCKGDKSARDNQNTQNQKKDTNVINKDQYRIAEIFTGGKNQIIDLMQGPATFDVTHKGPGKFYAALKYPDGTLLKLLADVTGDYKAKVKVDVPETRAYVLDVETPDGEWSIYRE